MLGDFGHQRASNKPAERDRLVAAIDEWFAHYVRGDGSKPAQGVDATTQRCPRTGKAGRTFRARSFAALARHKRVRRFKEAVTVTSVGGDPAVGAAIDPVAGMGDGCVEIQRSEAPGTARYELKPAGRKALTLIGAPLLRARLGLGGAEPGIPQLNARLWDIAPDGTQSWSRAASIAPPRARTAGSYTPTAGASSATTPPSWSCSARTRPTRAHRTAPSRWTSSACGLPCRPAEP